MKLVVVGGTGGTGRQIIKQGLERGHFITALVRKPEKLKIEHPNLKITQGDVLQPKSLAAAFADHDAVISALGHKKFIIKTSILSKGTASIIAAMKQNRIKRFICITSLGINDGRFKLGLYYTLFVIPFILLFYFLDKEKQERLIQITDLDWTIVRPAQLTNGKKRTTYKHGPNLGHYILTKMISRASVADFILNELEANQYLKKAVALTN